MLPFVVDEADWGMICGFSVEKLEPVSGDPIGFLRGASVVSLKSSLGGSGGSCLLEAASAAVLVGDLGGEAG